MSFEVKRSKVKVKVTRR